MYRGVLGGRETLAKHRFGKSYRLEVLDRKIRSTHMAAEARALVRAKSLGVGVPEVYLVDPHNMVLYMEYVHGVALKHFLNAGHEGVMGEEGGGEGGEGEGEALGLVHRVLREVGAAVGALHNGDVIHGDLTTSNFMLAWEGSAAYDSLSGAAFDAAAFHGVRGRGEDIRVVAIDFGLSSFSRLDGAEDKAVDLYVLERAFLSTHPGAEELFAVVLSAYRNASSDPDPVFARLDIVRARGRKREMFG